MAIVAIKTYCSAGLFAANNRKYGRGGACIVVGLLSHFISEKMEGLETTSIQ